MPKRRFALVLLGLALAPSTAFADGDRRGTELATRVDALDRAALEDYELLDFEKARAKLERALALVAKTSPGDATLRARLELHLGVVLVNGFKDRKASLAALRRAVKLAPDSILPRALATDETTRLLDLARDQPDEEPDLPAEVDGLVCPQPDTAPAAKLLALRCAVGNTITAARVVLFYRPAGVEDFVLVPMTRSHRGWYRGAVPATAVRGKSLQLYFEARDAAGKPLAARGRADSPEILLVEGGDGDDDAATRAAMAHRLACADDPLAPCAKEISHTRPPPRRTKDNHGARRGWLAFSIGSGIGVAPGHAEYRSDLSSSGVGLGGLGHAAPEVGVYLSRNVALALQGRDEWIPETGDIGGARGAHSVLLRVLRFVGDGRLRGYASAMAGGGEGLRFVVHPMPGAPAFADTVRAGVVLVGAGGGVTYDLATAGLSLVAESNMLVGAPHLGAGLDAHAGLSVGF